MCEHEKAHDYLQLLGSSTAARGVAEFSIGRGGNLSFKRWRPDKKHANHIDKFFEIKKQASNPIELNQVCFETHPPAFDFPSDSQFISATDSPSDLHRSPADFHAMIGSLAGNTATAIAKLERGAHSVAMI